MLSRRLPWRNVSSQPSPEEGVANAGWLRPPLVFLLAIAAGIIAEQLYPAPLPARTTFLIAGALCAVVGILLFISSQRIMAKAGTPLPGNKPTLALVRSGPFRFFALVPAACLIDFVVIRREERYLEARFGDSYLQYKASVRRWI